MNISNNNHPHIFDLPNEILFIIINKLNIVDVSYSLVDLNERFAQLVLNPLYIQNLDITIVLFQYMKIFVPGYVKISYQKFIMKLNNLPLNSINRTYSYFQLFSALLFVTC